MGELILFQYIIIQCTPFRLAKKFDNENFWGLISIVEKDN